MKTIYRIVFGAEAAVAKLIHNVNCWYILEIHVPESMRGCGYGRQLLNEIIKDADKEKIQLELKVKCFGNRPIDMNNADLREWYSRSGFVCFGELMVRYPGESNVTS